MFEANEARVLLEQRYELSKMVVEGPVRGDLFAFALANFIKKSLPSNHDRVSHLFSRTVRSEQDIEKLLADSLEIIYKLVTEDIEYGKYYSTGALAKLFGVSITTIHNWLNEGRFVGVEKTPGKQTRFSETVRWRSPNGELYTIREIAEKHRPHEPQKTSYYDEQLELTNGILYFEQKYGLSYHDFCHTFDVDSDYQLKRDAEEWLYLINRLEGEQ